MLPGPTTDFAEISDVLGRAWAVGTGEAVAQYAEWADRCGVFALLKREGSLRVVDIAAQTELTLAGVSAIVPVLVAVKILNYGADGDVRLCGVAAEYLLRESPYYAGDGLYLGRNRPLPANYSRNPPREPVEAAKPWGVSKRLRVQHSRNFAPSVIAARSGEFSGTTNLLDIAGGSGVLSIPLVLDHPDMRVTLVDLPTVIDGAREFLAAFGLEDRVTLIGSDVVGEEWRFAGHDAIHFGNFFHTLNDDTCRTLCERSFRTLPGGGRIFLHEVLFDESGRGPLQAALWNAIMLVQKDGGRQRKGTELAAMLAAAGFADCRIRPTALHYSLVSAVKPKS